MNRAEFLGKVQATMGIEETKQVETAYLLSKLLHKGQVRREKGADGQPIRYFEHPRRVALSLIEDAGITAKPRLLIAALLHDTIEDAEEVQLTSTLIERLFSTQTANWVRAVSKIPKVGYVERLTAAAILDPCAILVKAADRLDNLRSLPANDALFSERQKRETREVLMPIFNQCLGGISLGDWKSDGLTRLMFQIAKLV